MRKQYTANKSSLKDNHNLSDVVINDIAYDDSALEKIAGNRSIIGRFHSMPWIYISAGGLIKFGG
jgi:hypothetical protein